MEKKLLTHLRGHLAFGIVPRYAIKLIIVISIAGSQTQAGAPGKSNTISFLVQAASVQGIILSETGAPLPGVNIIEKGTSNGTTSDSNGRYSLAVADADAVLVFSFIGFISQEVNVNGRSALDITLIEDVRSLDEIVVVGYSSQEKKDITGSVGVVNTEALKSIPTGSASQALQGLASGVTVISSGAPGGRNDIFIRGVTSFGNTQPLVIVDGIQVQNGLNDININDIESMQVLKDAGAAAIYGVRGSNGVIVVTTKKGKTGEPVFSYDAYYGVQTPAKGNVFDLLNSEDYARMIKQVNPGTVLFANGLPDYTYAGSGVAGVAMAGDPAVDPAKYNFDAANPDNDYLIQKVNKTGTDWFHEVFKNAPMQSHNLSVSGGAEKAKYLFSLGYLNQQGTLIETFLKRYSARINTQYNLKKNIRIGQNAYLFYKQNPGFTNQSEGNAISVAYRIQPIIPVRDIMGNYGGTWLGPDLGTTSNPVAIQERTRNDKDNFWNMTGNVFAEIDFLKHFTARTSFGGVLDNRYYYNFEYNRYNDKEAHAGENSFSENALYSSSSTWTNTLNYNNTIDKHSFHVLLGSELINNAGRSLGGGANNFFSTDPDYLVLSNGTSNVTNRSSAFQNSLFSLFARIDYSFEDKYLLAATIRRDGSSVFGPEKRYGVFPSFSAGWRISQEQFMEDFTFLDDLKLRGSYGVLGSQANVNAANAFTLFNSEFGRSYYAITGSNNATQQGFFQSRNGNPNTGWEEDVITNIGFDATVLNNKLDVSLEWYKKSINGLLFPLLLPATAGGAEPPTINVGDIQNKGWDFSIGYRGDINTDIQFRVGANITTYKNLVVNIPDPGYFDVAGSRIGNMVRNEVGHPVASFFGYRVVGLFRDDNDVSSSPDQTDAAPGRFKYADIDGDNEITPEDRTFFGDPNPDFTYGITLGLNFKGFDFSTILYGSQGNDAINLVHYYTHFFGTSEGKGKSNVLKDAWTPENQGATTPIAEYASTFSTNGAFNSYFMENGSFLKMRSLIVGYSVNPAALERYDLNKVRIYFQAANLFTITKYSGLDPELTGSLDDSQSSASFGIDYGNYPNNQKNFLLGLNLTF
jgi:TonB-dependent starch-binding outer membrane protein SusC